MMRSEHREFNHNESATRDSNSDLGNSVLQIAKQLLPALNKERQLDILMRRFAIGGYKEYTLDEIGQFYDISRERVRQLEDDGLKVIQKSLNGVSLTSAYQLPPRVIEDTLAFATHLNTLGDLVLETEITQYLRDRYACSNSQIDPGILRLLLTLMSYERLPKSAGTIPIMPAWAKGNYDKTSLRDAVQVVYRILQKHVKSMSFFDLKVASNQRRTEKFTDQTLRLAIKVCAQIEPVDTDQYQVAFEHLLSLGDKAYRILHSQSENLHLSDLKRKIEQNLAHAGRHYEVNERALDGQLVADKKRFKSIGRTRIWTLKEKGVASDTIVSLSKQCLRHANTVMSVEDIYQFVHAKRPDVSKNSVFGALAVSPEFTGSRKHGYGLASWSRGTRRIVKNREGEIRKTIYQAVADFLQAQPGGKAPLTTVSTSIMKTTGCHRQTFYRYLGEMDNVKKEGTGRNTICYWVPGQDQISSKPTQNSHERDEVWLRNLIRQKEGLKLDFKQEYKLRIPANPQPNVQIWKSFIKGNWNEFVKDVIALTNGNIGTAGDSGFLVIGVGDTLHRDGTRDLFDTSGLSLKEQEILNAVNQVCSPHLPNLFCHSIVLDGKQITVIEIPPTPYVHEITKPLASVTANFDSAGTLVRCQENAPYTAHTAFIRRNESIAPASHIERNAIAMEKQNKFSAPHGQ